MKAIQWVVIGTFTLLAAGLSHAVPLPEDINGDGVVDVEDALLLFAKWHAGQKHTPTFTPTPSATPLPELTIPLAGLPAGATPLIMVQVPAGSFMMGRYDGEQDSWSGEEPRHQVTIDYEFYMGKYEITKAQWVAVMGTSPWQERDYVLDDPNSPAVYVSWNDIRGATGFLNQLNALGQGMFRLPSEAEWEYACRAHPSGDPTRFYWGDDPGYTQIGNYAWYRGSAWNVGEGYAHIVGLKIPNAWGLYDMSGNVWEWCEDWWNDSYQGAPSDGSAWTTGDPGSRVFRGGDFFGDAYLCRSAGRSNDDPDLSGGRIGLRVVRTASGPVSTPTPTPTETPTPTPTASATPLPEITIPLAGLPVGATPLVMVRVPAGSFMLGRYSGEQDSWPVEDPQHQVTIGAQYYVAKYEITQAQWNAIMHTTPWAGQDYVLDDPDSPAVYVSWSDAQALITALNKIGQGTFRLPSEAEWEYACRAGTTTRFSWGDDPSSSEIGNYAWYVDNAGSQEPYGHRVGRKLPNAWGLFDMSGNVWEWCLDDWHFSYTGTGRPDNGSAWVDGPRGSSRVFRGGCMYNNAGDCRSAGRNDNSPDFSNFNLGLRVLRAP